MPAKVFWSGKPATSLLSKMGLNGMNANVPGPPAMVLNVSNQVVMVQTVAMLPAVTAAGGMGFGAPNTGKIPGPAGPMPAPFVAQANPAQVNPGTCSPIVMVAGAPPLDASSKIMMTQGDAPAVAGGGVISSMQMGPGGFIPD